MCRSNRRRGSVRGMHFQAAPHAEAKLVRCTAGRMHDVIIDLRPDSPTYTQHVSVELGADYAPHAIHPRGIRARLPNAHRGRRVFYQMSAPFVPGAARGVRYNDPAFAIAWPLPVTEISPKDAAYPDFRQEA